MTYVPGPYDDPGPYKHPGLYEDSKFFNEPGKTQ